MVPTGTSRDKILTAVAGLVAALSMPATPRLVYRLEPELHQRIVLLVGAQNHMPAAPAVSTRRAAPRNKPFPPKRDAAAPAAPRLDRDFRFVDEHGETRLARRKAHRQKT